MTVYIGPTNWWWRDNPDAAFNCKVKGTLNDFGLGAALPDGSTIMCASSGLAILVAPSCTQVCSTWKGGCCVSEWTTLETALTNAGFTPSDWFVPDVSRLELGYYCKDYWDSYSTAEYWTSVQYYPGNSPHVNFNNGAIFGIPQSTPIFVRAFRCVTY